ncbi:hypothetical protein H9P43_003926 [Blastocladiella emersonii ATCC 22665]|nr:hypothetical protein H9P43_003926 [Blastocladiella emersonii ATCC 22665]
MPSIPAPRALALALALALVALLLAATSSPVVAQTTPAPTPAPAPAPGAGSASNTTTAPAGQCIPYKGIACSKFVNYTISSSLPIEAIEKAFAAAALPEPEMNALLRFYPKCADAFQRWACTSRYFKCEGTGSSVTQSRPCVSVCTDVTAYCTTPFFLANRTNMIPQCDTPTVRAATDRTDKCVRPAAPLGSLVENRACPEPLLPHPRGELNPETNRGTATGGTCFGQCCIPCPAINAFYPKGKIDALNMGAVYVRGVSSVLALFVLLSYLFLPNKRKHPAIIVLFFSLAQTFWMANIWFGFPAPKRVQCAWDAATAVSSPIIQAKMNNNVLCAVQGTFIMFFAHLAIIWACYLVMNLHLSAVWRSNFLERHFHVTSLVCWVWPLVFTIWAYLAGAVEFNSGATCLVSADWSNALFFYPLLAIVGPAFVIHLVTFYSIARASIRESVSVETSQVNSQTGSRSGKDPYYGYSSNGQTYSQSMASGPQQSGGSSGAAKGKHVVKAVKVQWRALLLAMQLIVSFMIFWVFYFFEMKKLKINGTEAWFKSWVSCISANNGQDECANRISPDVPSFPLMVFSDLVVSTPGIVLFIIFGARMSILYEWRTWFAEGCCMRRRKRDQPYANYI